MPGYNRRGPRARSPQMDAPPQHPRGWNRRSALLLLGLGAGLAFVYRHLLTGHVIAGRDAFRIFIPDSALLLDYLRHRELPLWNPYVNLGQPFAATLQAQAFYPPHWLVAGLFGPVLGYTVGHVLHAALACAGTYRLCRALRCSSTAAAFAAAAFGLSPLFACLAGLRNIASSAAWSGFIALAALRLAEAPSVRRAGALAGFVALSFLCGSPETMAWQTVLAVLVLVTAAPRKPLALAAGAGAFAWGAALSALTAVPAVELALHSTRAAVGQGDQLTWSASWAQLVDVAWPFAELPRGPYWGPDQWLLLNIFAGTCTAALALVALRSSRRVEPFVLGAIAFAALSLGAHLPPAAWLLTHPPFSFFRYPAKYLVGVCFCLAVLAALGLDRLAVLARRVRPSPVRVGASLAGCMALLAGLPPLTRHPPFRAGAQDGAAWIALFLGGLAVLFFALPDGPRRPGRVRRAAAALGLLELGIVHLTQVASGSASPERLEAPSAMAQALPQPFTGRISVDVYGPDHGGSKMYEGVALREASRDVLIPNRFAEDHLRALEGYGAPEPHWVPEFNRSNTRAVFDLTGVQFYVRDGEAPFEDLTEVPVKPGLPHLYRSDTAMPRAFVVQQARVVPDGEALDFVTDEDEPARRTAYLAAGEPLNGEPCDSNARIVEEGAHFQRVEVDACAEGYLIVSDTFYPGWRAEVDGARATLYRADYALRAVRVTKGHHAVVFRYRPRSFAVGAALTAVALVGLAAALGRRAGARRAPPQQSPG